MPDTRTDRLLLHPIDVAEGERIAARRPGPQDAWAEDFPFDGDVVGARMFLQASGAEGEQQPFGYYRITRRADGLAIGGIGFKGRPVGGTVEIGYGLSPSARGEGYAAEAVVALLSVAGAEGLSEVTAETEADNVASQVTLRRAGFTEVSTDGDLHRYRAAVGPGAGSCT